MDIKLLREVVKVGKIDWQRHSLERMMERNISRNSVKQVLLEGELIEDYPDDTPYPSGLFLGWVEGEPIHVVVSLDFTSKWCFIITAYIPDLDHFEPDFKTRKK